MTDCFSKYLDLRPWLTQTARLLPQNGESMCLALLSWDYIPPSEAEILLSATLGLTIMMSLVRDPHLGKQSSSYAAIHSN